MPQLLTDDELLDVPLGNLMPGELARSFTVHAAHAQKTEEATAQQVLRHSDQQTVQDKEHEEQEALQRREEVVLARLAEREEALREEATLLDERTIKLHDGRRAYVDGDKFRDAEGQELTGADRAQAEVLRVEQPNAATWQEEQRIGKMWAENQKARKDIEDAKAGKPGTDAAAAVSSAENILARSKKIEALPDYGSSEISLSSPALKF